MNTGSNTSSPEPRTFLELDDFTQGYVECMFWAENDQNETPDDKSLEDKYDFDDFTPEFRAMVLNDCTRFQIENAAELAAAKVAKGFEALHEGTASDPVLTRAGHDFWLTRQNHSAGFWDGDWPKDIGAALTKYCEGAGELYVYVTDKGKIHVD